MTTTLPLLFALTALAYLIGSIPVAHLLCRSRGVDILAVGDGNPGAANVYRRVGRTAGVAVFALDASKGLIVVWVLPRVAGIPLDFSPILGAGALMGQWYPMFASFRGGVGLASAIGGGIGMLPAAGGIGLAIGAMSVIATRSAEYAAAFGFASGVGASYFLGNDWVAVSGAVGLALLTFGRHIAVRAAASAPATVDAPGAVSGR